MKPARKRKPASPLAPGADSQPFIVLTGLSGSGKSQAIHALEDLGGKVDKLLEQEEIHQSQEQRIDGAIEDVAREMFEAASSEDE